MGKLDFSTDSSLSRVNLGIYIVDFLFPAINLFVSMESLAIFPILVNMRSFTKNSIRKLNKIGFRSF